MDLISLHVSEVNFADDETCSFRAHEFMAHGMWVPRMTLLEMLGSGEKGTLLASLGCGQPTTLMTV